MAKLVLCHVAKLSKIKQMWHFADDLLQICYRGKSVFSSSVTLNFVESPKSRKPVSTILEIGVGNDEQISPDELKIWLARRKEIYLSRSP